MEPRLLGVLGRCAFGLCVRRSYVTMGRSTITSQRLWMKELVERALFCTVCTMYLRILHRQLFLDMAVLLVASLGHA
jgi:hypothetical protein